MSKFDQGVWAVGGGGGRTFEYCTSCNSGTSVMYVLRIRHSGGMHEQTEQSGVEWINQMYTLYTAYSNGSMHTSYSVTLCVFEQIDAYIILCVFEQSEADTPLKVTESLRHEKNDAYTKPDDNLCG